MYEMVWIYFSHVDFVLDWRRLRHYGLYAAWLKNGRFPSLVGHPLQSAQCRMFRHLQSLSG